MPTPPRPSCMSCRSAANDVAIAIASTLVVGCSESVARLLTRMAKGSNRLSRLTMAASVSAAIVGAHVCAKSRNATGMLSTTLVACQHRRWSRRCSGVAGVCSVASSHNAGTAYGRLSAATLSRTSSGPRWSSIPRSRQSVAWSRHNSLRARGLHTALSGDNRHCSNRGRIEGARSETQRRCRWERSALLQARARACGLAPGTPRIASDRSDWKGTG